MKKVWIIALALCLALGLCACGGIAPDDQGHDCTTTTTTSTEAGGHNATTNNSTTIQPTTANETDFTYENEDVFNDAELDWG